MENNLNQKVIRRYSREFAEKVCVDFFASHESVTNDQIMEVQSIRQVNLFVVKNLFDQWQQEIRRLKSPYFNYGAENVVAAMDKLKNALSRSILLSRDTYQPLLEKSTEETLRLILSPYDYYKELIEIDEALLTPEYLKSTSKYMKVNPFIVQALLEQVEKENISVLTHEKAKQLLDQVVDKIDGEPDDVEPHIASFSAILPITLEELYGVQKENTPRENEPSGNVRTIHDDLVQEDQSTLADLHSKQKIEDIRGHLSINQRFMFVNALFDGDENRFNEVIDHIERQESADEAIHYLHAAFGEWDRQREEVQDFMSIVKRRHT